MEALLSLAFDNLSSYDAQKIRKGLRQVEGLLAQICLSPAPRPSTSSRPPTARSDQPPPQSAKKELSDLSTDPAFREFFKLQDGFEWNVASRLLHTLDRLLGKSNQGDNDLVIIQTLDLLQGLMLLHPPSRNLFRVEQHMNALLELLEPENCPAIHIAALLTLVCALLDTPPNIRTFETMDGLFTITSLFKSRETSSKARTKALEFIYFYLMPETPSLPSISAANMLQRSPSKLAGAFGRPSSNGRKRADSESEMTRTTGQKEQLLGRFLSNVQDLVEDLRESTPFGRVLA